MTDLLTMPMLTTWLLLMCLTQAASDAAGATTADA